MLHILIKEFLVICDYLVRKQIKQKKGYLLIEKQELEALLNQNTYETSANKLRYWKQLGWIDAEPNRLTKRVYDAVQEKYLPYVKIDIKRYECMKQLKESVSK